LRGPAAHRREDTGSRPRRRRLAGARAQQQVKGRRIGYDYLHVAVDDHSRLAYIEVHPDEKEATCALFLHRAATWFHDQHRVRILRVLTDNALAYRRGSTWAAVCVALGIRRRFTKPGCPWTNGKAERLNRTLLCEYAYARAWTSNAERVAALDSWVRHYNTERAHSALGGHPRSAHESPMISPR